MMVLVEFYIFHEKISQAQKAQTAQNVRQALLPLRRFYAHKNAIFFIRLCALCAFYAKQATFFFLDVFMRV